MARPRLTFGPASHGAAGSSYRRGQPRCQGMPTAPAGTHGSKDATRRCPSIASSLRQHRVEVIDRYERRGGLVRVDAGAEHHVVTEWILDAACASRGPRLLPEFLRAHPRLPGRAPPAAGRATRAMRCHAHLGACAPDCRSCRSGDRRGEEMGEAVRAGPRFGQHGHQRQARRVVSGDLRQAVRLAGRPRRGGLVRVDRAHRQGTRGNVAGR